MKVLRTGLIGAGIGRSRFAAALELMCERNDLTLAFQAIDTGGRGDFDFVGTVDACRANGWTGVAVTHPFKPDAAHYGADQCDAQTRKLGACNTLVFGPPLVATNTDYFGFIDAWKTVFPGRKPGRVALAGAGGVARAIAPALAGLGAEHIDIWDPSPGMADDLAARTGPSAHAIPLTAAARAIGAADGLVNATPLGMTGHPGSAFPPDQIGGQSGQSWAFDAVYTPCETTFLARARAQGLAILTGFDLFRFMAIRSFTAFTGLAPNQSVSLTALEPLYPQRESA